MALQKSRSKAGKPASRTSLGGRGAAKGLAKKAGKAPAKSRDVKKASALKAPLKKSSAKKTPVKKATAKKTAAKGSTAVMRQASAVLPAALDARGRALDIFRFADTMVNEVAKGFGDDKATAQSLPTDNHLMWTLGHLAVSNFWLASLINGENIAPPAGYEDKFGMGSKPVDDATLYPPLDEVRREYTKSVNLMIASAESLDAGMLTEPPPVATGGFVSDRLNVLEKAAWHAGWHAGQLATLRRALGLAPMMG
jgi:hypothetical protein